MDRSPAARDGADARHRRLQRRAGSGPRPGVGGRIGRRVATVLGATLAACGVLPAPGVPGPEDGGSVAAVREAAEAAVRERQWSFMAAIAARDLEATLAHFADDAVLHVAGMPALEGRDAIRSFYGNVFRFLSASQATPSVLRVAAGGDVAFGTGSVANAFEGLQGRREFAGKYLLVWERRAGEWLVAVYALSSDGEEGGG
jgi:uncharacterized protein (TIGR02246 family)